MAEYSESDLAIRHARRLIEQGRVVLDSDWASARPSAADEDAFLEEHSFDEYAAWHLGLADGATDHTKERYAFPFGDFRRVHRSGLIACMLEAGRDGHREVQAAAQDLLQRLERAPA